MHTKTWKGVMFSLATFAVFSCGDAVVKYETRTHPVLQCAFFAMIGGSGAVLAAAARRGGIRKSLRTRNPEIQVLRAACLGLEFMLVLYAFSALPLAAVYTLVLSAPVLTALLAPVFTADRFDPRLLPAVLTGFAGVVVALHPGGMPFGPASAAALASAFLFALGNFIVRRMDPDENPLTFAFYPGLFTLAAAGAFMAAKQPPLPALPDIALMIAAGLSSVIGLGCLGRAMQLAPASLVMPFQYSQLLWGALFGVFVFGETMDPFMIMGAALILFSGLLLMAPSMTRPSG